MDTPIHEESYRDHTIKIIHDPDPESSRDYDNLGTMICWHKRYNLGDKHHHAEIVENTFMDELRVQICTIFYQLIKEAGAHFLSYDNFKRATELGVTLPAAAMQLRVFEPSHADSNQNDHGKVETINADYVVYVSEVGAIEEQNLAYARSSQRAETKLYDPKASFEGYEWYDQLARVSVKGYRVIGDTDTVCVEPGKRHTMTERPDQLEIHCSLSDVAHSVEWALINDWLVFGEDDWGLDEVDVAVTKSSKATSADLVDFLEHALFNPSDDSEAGSYDQQERWFRDETEDIAINLLETSLEAQINAITRVIDRELYWLRRSDQTITVQIDKVRIDVEGLAMATAEYAAGLLCDEGVRRRAGYCVLIYAEASLPISFR